MAAKYAVSTLRYFIQDTATGLGVAAKTASTDYTSLKLSQDGVLSADLKASLTITDEGGGWYSVALTALQSNYDCLAAVPIPVTATYQGYGVTLYTSKIDNAVAFLGLATAGANTTVTLASDPYGADNIPNGSIIEIVGGTGKGQNRTIIGYAYSTKIATVGRAWVTNPSTDSIVMIKQLNCARVDANLNVYSVDSSGNPIATDAKIGNPANIDGGGATLADNLKKLADDNGGLTFDATTDSQNKIAAAEAVIKALLDTTAMAELTSDPGATPAGIIKALMLLYMKARNLETTTATAKTVANSAGTTLLTHTLSDDGTTFSKGKLA
jgi:hypothetical protein